MHSSTWGLRLGSRRVLFVQTQWRQLERADCEEHDIHFQHGPCRFRSGRGHRSRCCGRCQFVGLCCGRFGALEGRLVVALRCSRARSLRWVFAARRIVAVSTPRRSAPGDTVAVDHTGRGVRDQRSQKSAFRWPAPVPGRPGIRGGKVAELAARGSVPRNHDLAARPKRFLIAFRTRLKVLRPRGAPVNASVLAAAGATYLFESGVSISSIRFASFWSSELGLAHFAESGGAVAILDFGADTASRVEKFLTAFSFARIPPVLRWQRGRAAWTTTRSSAPSRPSASS